MITISARPEFVEVQMAMMSESKEKILVNSLLHNNNFTCVYDIKDNITILGEFPSLKYDIEVFKLDKKVVVAIQVHNRNFK